MLEGGNPIARHHGKGLERATFCHGVELSYCLVTVRALTETDTILAKLRDIERILGE